MSKNENGRIDRKVKTYIDDLFNGVENSKQLSDLKEELATNLKEKIADYQSRGMDNKQAFNEAVISMGDLSGLVDDMRKLGQEQPRQTISSTKETLISTIGIVVGVLLVLFGIFVSTMVYFMKFKIAHAVGPGIFIVVGGVFITFSSLIRETEKRYGMNKIRAALYALSVGFLLFGLFVLGMQKDFTAIAPLMVFSLIGVGLFLYLFLTETDRKKHKN